MNTEELAYKVSARFLVAHTSKWTTRLSKAKEAKNVLGYAVTDLSIMAHKWLSNEIAQLFVS